MNGMKKCMSNKKFLPSNKDSVLQYPLIVNCYHTQEGYDDGVCKICKSICCSALYRAQFFEGCTSLRNKYTGRPPYTTTLYYQEPLKRIFPSKNCAIQIAIQVAGCKNRFGRKYGSALICQVDNLADVNLTEAKM